VAALSKPIAVPKPIERTLAALVFAIPLWYLVTERTREVFVVTWCKTWTAQIVAYAGFYAVLLRSYRWSLPGWLAVARRLALVLVGSTFAALAALEVGLRASDDAPYEEQENAGRHAPDPDVGHVYVANHTQTLQSREHRASWHSNAQGVRADRDFGPKAPGTMRIVCSGDSFTACDQVDYDESWPAVLEACLAPSLAPLRVEVVNAGFPGFGTVNEARWIAKFGAAFEPDLVVLAMTPNDLLENQFPLQYTARDGALVSSASTEADRLRYLHRSNWWCLPGVCDRSFVAQRISRSPALRRALGKPPVNHMEAYLVEPSEKARTLYGLAERYVEEARANAAALGARFAVVVIPYSHQLRPLGEGLDASVYGRHWVEHGASAGFPVVDCLPAFLGHPRPETLHWREDTHCTAEGYALVARTLCAAMVERPGDFGVSKP
jgi:hypothetical protein